jgi:hypothetical protein
MKKYGVNLGTISMIVGGLLCGVKFSGVALATWSWWVVTLPLYLPFVLFGLFMLLMYLLVGTRYGVDAVAGKAFEPEGFSKAERNRYNRMIREGREGR